MHTTVCLLCTVLSWCFYLLFRRYPQRLAISFCPLCWEPKTLLLLAMERTLGLGIFDPHLGGDPVLFQHFFWFYSHPAVYIMIVPGMADVNELLATFSRKAIFGYFAVAM